MFIFTYYVSCMSYLPTPRALPRLPLPCPRPRLCPRPRPRPFPRPRPRSRPSPLPCAMGFEGVINCFGATFFVFIIFTRSADFLFLFNLLARLNLSSSVSFFFFFFFRYLLSFFCPFSKSYSKGMLFQFSLSLESILRNCY